MRPVADRPQVNHHWTWIFSSPARPRSRSHRRDEVMIWWTGLADERGSLCCGRGTTDHRLPPRRGERLGRRARMRAQPACPPPAALPAASLGPRSRRPGGPARHTPRVSVVRAGRDAQRAAVGTDHADLGREHHAGRPETGPSDCCRKLGTDRRPRRPAALRRRHHSGDRIRTGSTCDASHPTRCRAPCRAVGYRALQRRLLRGGACRPTPRAEGSGNDRHGGHPATGATS